MELRQLDIYLPQKHAHVLESLLEEQPTVGVWHLEMNMEQVLFRVIIGSEFTEGMLDTLEKHFAGIEGYRAVVLPVQASLPRVEASPEESEAGKPRKEDAKTARKRISREELYAAISAAGEMTPIFLILTGLASIVAFMGLLRGEVPVIIGAMVLAPLLGPNMAQALGTTLGDTELFRKASRANITGTLLVVALSALIGIFVDVSPELPEIASRTQVRMSDVTLALAAGAAGAFSLSRGIAVTVIGVAAALALLPPLVVSGMLLGAGYLALAVNALLLALTNIISLNLAAIATFLIEGLRPAKWWEEYKAKKAVIRAVALWSGLLIILMLLAVLFQSNVWQ